MTRSLHGIPQPLILRELDARQVAKVAQEVSRRWYSERDLANPNSDASRHFLMLVAMAAAIIAFMRAMSIQQSQVIKDEQIIEIGDRLGWADMSSLPDTLKNVSRSFETASTSDIDALLAKMLKNLAHLISDLSRNFANQQAVAAAMAQNTFDLIHDIQRATSDINLSKGERAVLTAITERDVDEHARDVLAVVHGATTQALTTRSTDQTTPATLAHSTRSGIHDSVAESIALKYRSTRPLSSSPPDLFSMILRLYALAGYQRRTDTAIDLLIQQSALQYHSVRMSQQMSQQFGELSRVPGGSAALEEIMPQGFMGNVAASAPPADDSSRPPRPQPYSGETTAASVPPIEPPSYRGNTGGIVPSAPPLDHKIPPTIRVR